MAGRVEKHTEVVSEPSSDSPVSVTEERPSSAHELKHEMDTHTPLHEKVPTPLLAGNVPPQAQEGVGPSREPDHEPQSKSGRETPDLQMPGSFDLSSEEQHHHHAWEGGWMGLFKKFHIGKQ